jgi:hypothetical protein
MASVSMSKDGYQPAEVVVQGFGGVLSDAF